MILVALEMFLINCFFIKSILRWIKDPNRRFTSEMILKFLSIGTSLLGFLISVFVGISCFPLSLICYRKAKEYPDDLYLCQSRGSLLGAAIGLPIYGIGLIIASFVYS